MKKLNLFACILALVMIFAGCSKEEAAAPDPIKQDQATPDLKFTGTPFTVTSTELGGILDGGKWTFLPNGDVKIKGMVAEWYDVASTPMLTGTSLYTENWIYNENDPTIKFWGKVDLSVEGDDGVWEGSWHGYGTFLGDPPYSLMTHIILVDEGLEIVYTGHGGSIQGMVAKATYSLETTFEGDLVVLTWYGHGFYK